jgi:hypothetical protein
MKTARTMTLRRLAMAHGSQCATRSARLMALALAVTVNVGVVAQADPPAASSDALYRKMLVGTWKGQNFGEQVLTNNSDGTAHLTVTLNRLAALRYGRSLVLRLTWTVERGIVRHKVTGGSPPEKVARLINDFGDSQEYRLSEVREAHFLLSDPDDASSQHRWESMRQADGHSSAQPD